MELYIFNKEDSNEIGNYNSISAFYSKILKTEEATNIGFIHIDPDGIVGYHEAPVPQLFISSTRGRMGRRRRRKEN